MDLNNAKQKICKNRCNVEEVKKAVTNIKVGEHDICVWRTGIVIGRLLVLFLRVDRSQGKSLLSKAQNP